MRARPCCFRLLLCFTTTTNNAGSYRAQLGKTRNIHAVSGEFSVNEIRKT